MYERSRQGERILIVCLSFSLWPQLSRLPRGTDKKGGAELLLDNIRGGPTLGELPALPRLGGPLAGTTLYSSLTCDRLFTIM